MLTMLASGRGKFGIILATILILMLGVTTVFAGGYNLTALAATATINGAIFEVFVPIDPTGSGVFAPFVRLSTNNPVMRGYNTDYRPLQFDENNSATFTLSRLLSEVPIVNEGGVDYREFQLDINQNVGGTAYLLTLDTLEIYESLYSDLCGYPFDGSGGGHSGCVANNTATMIYDMDGNADNFAVMDYRNNTGSGKRDLRVLVPNSLFNQDPNCSPGAVGCTTYITTYSEFGADFDAADPDPILQEAHGNNDGFEEWGVKPFEPTAVSLSELTASQAALPVALALSAVLLLAVTLLAHRRSRKTIS